MSGTLVYGERAPLSDAAVATLTVVQLLGDERTVTVVGSQVIDAPGDVPIAFDVPLDLDVLDRTVEARIWATVVDGDNAWVTEDGVAVATNGAPAQGVVVRLTYRPDLLEGEVSGIITGAGPGLSDGAYYMSWIVDESTASILAFEQRLAGTDEPIPFAIPFAVADLDREAPYVVNAAVFDGDSSWTTEAAVPVITEGNPFTDVDLVVSPEPTPTPSPTPSPTPIEPASGGGIDLIWILLAGVAIGGLLAGVFWFLRRGDSGA